MPRFVTVAVVNLAFVGSWDCCCSRRWHRRWRRLRCRSSYCCTRRKEASPACPQTRIRVRDGKRRKERPIREPRIKVGGAWRTGSAFRLFPSCETDSFESKSSFYDRVFSRFEKKVKNLVDSSCTRAIYMCQAVDEFSNRTWFMLFVTCQSTTSYFYPATLSWNT